MSVGVVERFKVALARLRRLARQEVRDLGDWLENTRNLLHLSVLVFLPLLIGLVTFISNASDLLPFLLFPPLASGAYTLFAHPESRYASPRRFVGGLTTGALCGWIALRVAAEFWYHVPPEQLDVHPGAAAFGVFLTGAVTWALDIEESSAFSTALLVLVTGTDQILYVVSVVLSTALIASVFVLWRRHFYEQRARYLYRSTRGDDRVLVPMRGEHADATAMLGARLAAAHDAGKVVLLDVVEVEAVAEVERALLAGDGDVAGDGGGQTDPEADEEQSARSEAEERLAAESAADLERRADRIEAEVDVPCQVIVAVDGGDPAGTVTEAARDANCDLIAVAHDGENGRLSGLARGLLGGETDVIVHRSIDGEVHWPRVIVPVRKAGDVAHAMIDFARRLADPGGVSVCHCIDTARERRGAEEMLANLVETVPGPVETRIAREALDSFLERNAADYDLVIVGASTDRSAASRFVAPPTFRELTDVGCDVAIVHRG